MCLQAASSPAIGRPFDLPSTMAQTGGADAVGGPGEATSKKTSSVPGETSASSAQAASGERAQSVMERLDGLMLHAAKISTQTIGEEDLGGAIRAANIPMKECAALQDAFAAARDTMRSISQFTGRQIADGLVKSGGRFKLDDEGNVAMTLKRAIEAQGALAQAIRKLMDDHPKMSDAAYDRLMDLSLQCDRRMAEINRLALQVANAADAAEDGESGADALLDSEFVELMARQELEMHGNADRLETLKKALSPLAKRVESFAANPNASLGIGEYLGCMLDLKTARVELNKVAAKGIEYKSAEPAEPSAPPRMPTVARMKEAASEPPAPPAKPALHVLPDNELLTAAVKVLDGVKDTLDNARQRIGDEMLRDFADRTFSLGERFPHLANENLPMLQGMAPTIAHVVAQREALREAAMNFMKCPDSDHLEALWACSYDCQGLESNPSAIRGIKLELSGLRRISGRRGVLPHCDDWGALEDGICKVGGLHTQVAHFVQMVLAVRDDLAPHKFLTTTSALALMEGRLEFPALVEARVHGMNDADVDPACDDSHACTSVPLGSGWANTVQLVTYDDGSERVFKAESAGRQGIEGLRLSQDYLAEQQMVQLNLATQDAAKALDLGDVVVKCSVGVHDGDFGLFMEKGTGMDGNRFAAAASAKGSLTAEQVKALEPGKHARAIGGLLRGLNRLEWLDLVTGQGDRHAGNYMIDVRDGEDVSVTVKGIDNDECFPAYRKDLRTFVLDDAHTGEFYRVLREDVLPSYPPAVRQAVVDRIEHDPGIKDNGDGTITIDTTAFKAGELYMAATNATGAHGLALPKYIDEDLYRRLVALKDKNGAVRKGYLASLRTRLPKEAVDSAERRLDEAIRLAEELKGAEMVFSARNFADPEVQRRIVESELGAPDPVQPAGGFSLPPGSRIRIFAQTQTKSIFARDVLAAVAKDGEFAQAVAP